jgi:hypothetical protein
MRSLLSCVLAFSAFGSLAMKIWRALLLRRLPTRCNWLSGNIDDISGEFCAGSKAKDSMAPTPLRF